MKLADERIGGPYLRYDNEKSEKAIGMPPEEPQSPAFSRSEPPSQGGFTTSQVSLPRYQFEVSEQPTMGTAKALPSAKESVASVIEKISQAVDEMDQGGYYYTPPPSPPSSGGSFLPPFLGGMAGTGLGWYAGGELGESRYPGYRTLDKLFDSAAATKLPNIKLLQDAADVGGGYLAGKKEMFKMLGPIGAYRIAGAGLGLGSGVIAGALVNKALEESKQASIEQVVSGAAHATPLWHDIAELGGLGILAVPSISDLAGHPWNKTEKDITEIGGLGLLATPSVVSRVRRLGRF
jgi:hypothetical protein